MGNAGRSTIDITADDRQARRTYRQFFDYIEESGRRTQHRMRNYNPMENVEREVERSSRNIGKPIRNLPEHLRGFDTALNATRTHLRNLSRTGTQSLDQLADATVRNRVELGRMMSASSSGKSAAKAVQELNAHIKETQLAVLGLNRNGTAKISTEESQDQLRRFQSELARTKQRLEALRDAGDFASYEAGMRVLERQTLQVRRAMEAAARGGQAYSTMINELGVHTQDAANRAAIAMEAYRDRFLHSIDMMNARKTQSQKMMDILPEVSHIQRIDRAFLQVGDRLERMARQGTAANIALQQLGPNASMKDLMDRIMLINTGLMRMQQVAIVAGIALAGFTTVMAKAAHGPDPAEIRQQIAEVTAVYAEELDKRTNEIKNFANIFEEVQVQAVSPAKLTKNLETQTKVLKNWMGNLKELAARGVDEGLIEELQQMGPKAANEVDALTQMTQEGLNHYVDVWREKSRLAKEQAIDELSELKEATDRQVKELQDSLKPLGIAWEKFKSTWAEALAPFVEIWGKIAAVVVDAGTMVGEFINKINELNPDIVKLIGMFAYLFTAMTLILAPMAIGIGRAQGMKAAFTLLWTTIGQGVLGFLRIAGMASVVSAALVLLGGTIMKLWKHSEIFRNSIINGWNDIKSAILEAIEPLIPKLEELWQSFLKLINILVGSDGSSTQSFWKGLGDAIGKIIDLLMKWLVPSIKFAVTVFVTELGLVIDVLTAIIKGLTFVITKIKEFAGAIAAIWNGNEGKAVSILDRLGFSPEAIKSIISSVSSIKKSVTDLYNTIQKGAETAKKYVQALFAAFKGDNVQAVKLLESLGFSDKEIDRFLKAIENVKKAFNSYIKFMKDEILPNYADFFKEFSRISGDLLGAFFKLLDGLTQFLTALLAGDWEGALEGIKTILSAFSDAAKLQIELLGSVLKLLFKNLWALLPDSMTEPIEKALKTLKKWYDDTIKFFKDLPGNTKSLLNEWGTNIETFFNELPGRARQKLDTWKKEISNWFSTKASDIKKDLDTWWVEMSNWFDSIPEKIKSKLISWKEAITQWFNEQNEENIRFYNQLWNAMSEWLSSIPSKMQSKLSEWSAAISAWFDETVSIWGENLEKWWTSIAAWWTTLPERMWEQLELWWTSISTWFDETTARWAENLEKWWISIVAWWTTLPERMWEQLELWWTSISTWFDETTARWAENLEKWWTSIAAWWTTLPDRMWEQLELWWTSISTWFDETTARWGENLEKWWNSIVTWWTTLPGRTWEQLEAWWNSISTWFDETAANWGENLEKWWAEIANWFSTLSSKPEIKDAARKTMDEMNKGFEEKKPELIDKLGEIVVDAFIALLAAAGIIALAVGRELLKRFINGMAGEQKNAEITADTIGKAILNILENVPLLGAAIKIIKEFKQGLDDGFSDVKATVSGWIEKIKSLFNFKLQLPEITIPKLPRLPQPRIVGSFSLNPPSAPSLEWHANGGFFDKATVIGIGEKGKEAAVPLVGRRMDPFADAVFNRFAENFGGIFSSRAPVSNNTDIADRILVTAKLYVDGEEMTARLDPHINRLQGNQYNESLFLKGRSR
ncbi:hypothetical protein [Bacillus luti]|uniref:hypothetical protein n=1 Tax=Bacillus luti TaxID=2026191 RepID=UPI00289B6A5D|nr:hypothetical protein [Bacillus luti]